MDILIQFLRDLLASGQAGVVIIALLIFIGGAIFVIWSQRQALARIELSMKAADTARQQLQDTIEKQYDFVVRTNDELRKELERYKSDQTKFENDVRKALTIGFDEVKTSLTGMTISDITEQIPEKLKKDLETEISQATERAIHNLIDQLKKSELVKKELFDNKELENILRDVSKKATQSVISELNIEFPNPQVDMMFRESIRSVLKELIDVHYYDNYGRSRFFRYSHNYDEQLPPNLLLVPMSDEAMNYLAAKVAEYLENPNRRKGIMG